MRLRFLPALILLTSIAPCQGAGAQQSVPTPVAEALYDGDGDRIPDRLGETVTLTGVLTTDPYAAADGERRSSLQDPTGGIRLTTLDAVLLADLRLGDRVAVVGTVGQYQGNELVHIRTIDRLGPGVVPEPRDVTVSDLVGERFSGQLVRIRGRIGFDSDLKLVDDSGEVRFYLTRKFFAESSFADELIVGRRVEVVGIAEQFDTRAPFTAEYRILPRDRADVRFALVPLSPAGIGLATALVVLVFLSLFDWRRNKVRRAVESEAYLAQLDTAFQGQRRFLADAGHEIRTPMTVLRGDLEVALLKDREPDHYKRVLQRAVSDLKVVSQLAQDLITLAQTDGGDLEMHRSDVVVDEIFDRLRDSYGQAAEQAGVRLQVETEPELTLDADPTLVERAVSNLLDNAIEYGGEGGIVTLSARSNGDGMVEVRVSDRGPGVAPSEQGRLFERFYRGEAGRARTGGSGLGLAIVEAVARCHGGSVKLQNGPDPGASFVMTFAGGRAADQRGAAARP